MLARVQKPSCAERNNGCNTREKCEAPNHGGQQKELKYEISQGGNAPSSPKTSDVALFRNDAIEQHESHSAAHIDERDQERQAYNDEHGDTDCYQKVSGRDALCQKLFGPA